MGRKRMPGLILRGGIWHIDKRILGWRVCESTGTAQLEEAERYLARVMEERRQAQVYGVRPSRSFEQAAAKFVLENQHKRSLASDIVQLRLLMPFIGSEPIDRLNIGTLQTWIGTRRRAGKAVSTINHGLRITRRILNLAATEWFDQESGLTWLLSAPKIKLLPDHNARQPYPLSWSEQSALFSRLPDHLAEMATFAVNTGCRDGEICRLRWEWEVVVAPLGISVFIVPGEYVKSREARLIEIIHLVEQSHLPARRTLEMLGIRPSTFYRWYDRYRAGGPEALEDKPTRPDRVWNRIPDEVRQRIVAMALDVPELSPRELATRFTDAEGYFVSESSVNRLLKVHDLITSPAFVVIKAADKFRHKTTAPNQLWQTDFTYLKVIGWGWFYLSTILDDFSRYIIAWKLCTTMKAADVTDTLQMALIASGCATARVAHKPRLLSDNGSSYVSGDLAKWLADAGMNHVRGAPCHPQTQGKIERWHQALKNRILLDNYYLPGDLEAHIDRFVDHYNHQRYHESLQNLTPADVYFGRGQTILLQRERIKRDTIKQRRLQHHSKAA